MSGRRSRWLRRAVGGSLRALKREWACMSQREREAVIRLVERRRGLRG